MNIGILFGFLFVGCPKKSSDFVPEKEHNTSPTTSNGFFDKRIIENEIRKHSVAISGCYAGRRFSKPNSTGRLLVEFVITPDGSVYSAYLKEDSLHSPTVSDCVLSVFEGMQFPAGMQSDIVGNVVSLPNGQRGIPVVYPLLFTLDED